MVAGGFGGLVQTAKVNGNRLFGVQTVIAQTHLDLSKKELKANEH
jgi:hypothetical protein